MLSDRVIFGAARCSRRRDLKELEYKLSVPIFCLARDATTAGLKLGV